MGEGGSELGTSSLAKLLEGRVPSAPPLLQQEEQTPDTLAAQLIKLLAPTLDTGAQTGGPRNAGIQWGSQKVAPGPVQLPK